MPRAGYCKSCQQNVFLDDSWGCVNGHDWTQIEGWYDTDDGRSITPHWVEEASDVVVAPVAEAPIAPEPIPEPEPEPEPIDPVEAMRDVVRDRMSAINLVVEDDGDIQTIARGEDYQAAVFVDGSGEIVLWERLSSGADPGVRNLLRVLAAEGGWRVRVVLKRDSVTG